MATTYDRHTTQTHQTGPHFRYDRDRDYTYGDKQQYQQSGPSGTKIMAIMALLPVGGILLGLAGLTFIATIIGLALATPVFIIFSPVIVPAVLTIGLAVTGFLTSGTFGLTGLSSLSYLVSMLRHSAPYIREDMDYVKGRIQDAGEYVGQKTKETGQAIKDRSHDIGEMGQGGQVGGYGANVQVGAHAGGAGVGGGGGVGVGAGGGKDRKEGGKGGDTRT